MPVTTPLPDPPSISSPDDFEAKADAFLGALPQFQAELDAFGANVAQFGRNLLLNGRFSVWQYATTPCADDTYALDRWYALTQSGSIGITRLGQGVEPGYNYALRMTQSQGTAQRFGIAQIVESTSCAHMIGNASTLSGRVRCSASTNIRYAILANTGTGDVVTSDFVNNWTSATYTAGNFFASSGCRVISVGVQAVLANTWTNLTQLTSAAIAAGATNLMVLVWTESAMAQNVTLDLDYVQLENGASATPAEMLPYIMDVMMCQRFAYRRNFGSGSLIAQIAMASSTVGQGVIFYLPVYPRAAPTITVAGGYLLMNPAQSGNSAFSGTLTTGDASGAIQFTGTAINALWSTGQTAILFGGGSTVDILCMMEL